jgi:hypothetical protein
MKGKTHGSWRKMRERCNNPNDIGWPLYGAKGISVCERWGSYQNFLADMGERPAGCSIDRWPNREGNYEPGNCRWATHLEQANNKSNNVFMTVNGVQKTVSEWSRVVGLPVSAISARKKRGWSDERALTQPSRGLWQEPIEFQGQKMLKMEFAKLIGMKPHNVYLRLKDGWTPDEVAATPVRPGVVLTIRGESMALKPWAQRSGVDAGTIKRRLALGWPAEQAVFAPTGHRVIKYVPATTGPACSSSG